MSSSSSHASAADGTAAPRIRSTHAHSRESSGAPAADSAPARSSAAIVPAARTSAPGEGTCAEGRGTPRSAIFTRPSSVTIRLSGVRSPCTTPCSSACARPASTPSSTPATWASVSPPAYRRSEPRSSNSIATNGVPSCSKTS
jgi:hypothetical protein